MYQQLIKIDLWGYCVLMYYQIESLLCIKNLFEKKKIIVVTYNDYMQFLCI